MQSTSGTFSDRVARLLTGEDGEAAVLGHYDLTDTEKQVCKREILNGNIVILADKYAHSRKEFKSEHDEKSLRKSMKFNT